MSHVRCIEIQISHDLYDTMQDFPTDADPIRSATTYSEYNDFNTSVSSIAGHWQHEVSQVVDANLQSVLLLTLKTEEEDEAGIVTFKKEWEEVYETKTDGTPVTISDLAAFTNPDWIDPNDHLNCKIALQFQYLMNAPSSADSPDSLMESLQSLNLSP